MEIIKLERAKIAQLKHSIALISYDEEITQESLKTIDIQPIVINRTTWTILNPHIRDSLFISYPNRDTFHCLLVEIEAEQEIAAAIILSGGIDGNLNAFPKDSVSLIEYAIRCRERLDLRPLLLAMGQDVDYWIQFFAFLDAPPDETEPPTAPQPAGQPTQWGIPELNLSMQATKRDIQGLHFKAWGSHGRSKKTQAYHFYVDDYRFKALETDSSKMLSSSAKVVIEPNYSTMPKMSLSRFIGDLHYKRSMACDWQAHGIKTIVDLNVIEEMQSHNLLGIPDGWSAYATRYTASDKDALFSQYELAKGRAGHEDILFIVYGSVGAESLCKANDWHFIHNGKSTGLE